MRAARARPASVHAARPQATRQRSASSDDLGLRRVLGDRMLPLLVAAMAFLASLALAGSVGAELLARHWQEGAASALTVQVPQPTSPAADNSGSRIDRVVALLRGTPGIASATALTDAQLADLLRPWLGAGAQPAALPLPGVVGVHLSDDDATDGGPDLAALGTRLDAAAPGTVLESHGIWVGRLSALARSLQACSWAALAVVAAVAAAVIAVATRAGLAARREAIEIVHGLGATDGYIAARFAARATKLAAMGGVAGSLAALPVLLLLADLAAPFGTTTPAPPPADLPAMVVGWFTALPPTLWLALPCLPLAACMIGFATAQGTVRRWLRQLP
ncbi:MAG TPA: FtsX-like permease family protein [Acetobacteraceae bacterium]